MSLEDRAQSTSHLEIVTIVSISMSDLINMLDIEKYISLNMYEGGYV